MSFAHSIECACPLRYSLFDQYRQYEHHQDGRTRRVPCCLVRAFAVDAVEDHSEHEEGAGPGQGLEGMRVQQAGHEQREDLPRGHDDGEDHGAELLDGVVDEQLARGGRDGQNGHVQEGGGVGQDEGQRGHELAGVEQSQSRQQLQG